MGRAGWVTEWRVGRAMWAAGVAGRAGPDGGDVAGRMGPGRGWDGGPDAAGLGGWGGGPAGAGWWPGGYAGGLVWASCTVAVNVYTAQKGVYNCGVKNALLAR